MLPRQPRIRGHETMMLPALHLAEWRATKDTLHLYSQILGKIRLATTAPRNHWWNVTLYVDVRGLTTRRLHHRGTTFDITIDFIICFIWSNCFISAFTSSIFLPEPFAMR